MATRRALGSLFARMKSVLTLKSDKMLTVRHTPLIVTALVATCPCPSTQSPRLLTATSVAVVELYEDVCGDEHLTVLPAKKIEGGYLAISHVWADGLGNLEATSLPQCQVMQLSQYTRQQSNCLHAVPPIRHFWVDTLCVPPDQVDRKRHPRSSDCEDAEHL